MKANLLLLAAVMVTGCTSAPSQQHKPRTIGMPNPASVYCIEQSGTLERVKTAQGEMSYCHLPNGERIEEWTLYRKNHANA